MATIGGNIALGRDDSYLMPALLAAKVRLLTAGLTEEGSIPRTNYRSANTMRSRITSRER
jgi:CO/xanthine dehydrogenase FAD-binding subunit